eukprot:m.51515 g.51515  ORF g.51515 m.51515 type:complete len:73 (-) comp9058_c0_seq1:1581-1799(-)
MLPSHSTPETQLSSASTLLYCKEVKRVEWRETLTTNRDLSDALVGTPERGSTLLVHDALERLAVVETIDPTE